MKKIIALFLAAMLLLSLGACSGKEQPTETSEPESTTEPSSEETSESTGESSSTQSADNETFGETLHLDFLTRMDEAPDQTALELAEAISSNPMIQFAPMTMEVEPGYLPGFDADITGFTEGATFSPMIGSIPFVGYIFKLDEGADVDAFIDTLTANHNLRWNVCVEAEQMIADHVGNTVFFVMCPLSAE